MENIENFKKQDEHLAGGWEDSSWDSAPPSTNIYYFLRNFAPSKSPGKKEFFKKLRVKFVIYQN